MEPPGPKSAGRSLQVARLVAPSQERPLSADDIQKAKMRAQFMQSKYGKAGAASGEGNQGTTEGPTKISPPLARTLFSASKAHVRPRVEERKDPVILPSQVSIQQEAPCGNKMNSDTNEPLWKKCKRVQIPWRTPAGTFTSSALFLTGFVVERPSALQVKIKTLCRICPRFYSIFAK